MNVILLSNSKMSFVHRVRACVETNNSVKDIFFSSWNIFSFFKVLINIRWSDVIWCEFASYPAFYGVLIGRLFNKKVVVHVHRFEVNEPTLFRPFIIWTIKNADKVVCPSRYIAENIKNLTYVEAEILYNSSPQPNDFEYILSVGALIKRKGHDRLIVEFKEKHESDNMKLIILGRGPEKNNLEKLIQELDLKRRVFIVPEYIPDVILDLLYKNCNQFALLSEDEGMSVAIIEAGMYDKEMWISDIEPNREYLSIPKEKFTVEYMEKSINKLLLKSMELQ